MHWPCQRNKIVQGHEKQSHDDISLKNEKCSFGKRERTKTHHYRNTNHPYKYHSLFKDIIKFKEFSFCMFL